MPTEGGPPRCGECGFRADGWTDRDTVTTARALDALLAGVLAGATPGHPEVERHRARLAVVIPQARAEAASGRISDPTLHEVQHRLHEIGRVRHELGEPPGPALGTVGHLHRGDGGVPKPAVDHVEVTWSGVVGDRQRTREHHGRPFQALCLWSTEVQAELQAEGHPIGHGSAGENVTISGLDWGALRPGVLLRLGPPRGGVLAEISSYAVPCKQNAAWFADRDFNRILHERHPGSSRLYATVLRPGRIAVGDPVVVEPDDPI